MENKRRRKKIELNITLNEGEEEKIEFEDMWTETGDTLFLRDNKSRLVLWKSYWRKYAWYDNNSFIVFFL